MKRICILLLAVLMLAGCAEKKTFETISDGLEPEKVSKPMEMSAVMPAGVTAPVLSSTTAGKLYEYEEYTVTMQAVAAGDFSGLVRSVTGYHPDDLQIIESTQAGLQSYHTVWTSVGEGQTFVGRACILTDGNYYYVLSAMVPENKASDLSEGELKEMFATFRAVPEEEIISSGS